MQISIIYIVKKYINYYYRQHSNCKYSIDENMHFYLQTIVQAKDYSVNRFIDNLIYKILVQTKGYYIAQSIYNYMVHFLYYSIVHIVNHSIVQNKDYSQCRLLSILWLNYRLFYDQNYKLFYDPKYRLFYSPDYKLFLVQIIGHYIFRTLGYSLDCSLCYIPD